MATNILDIPFRRSIQVDFSGAIKQYISSKYDQHPDMFADDLRQVDQLRADAISVHEAHASGVPRLTKYIAQLRYIGGKFPVDVGVDFPWYPALGFNKDKAVLQNNVRFELANVLFNLAALYSQLAFAGNRTTSEGLKSAAQYGAAAAGTLLFLRIEVIPDMRATPPEDMDAMTLESLEQLSLAQAQECFWQKAVKDGLKDGTISKLAAKVSDYYSLAAELAIKSDAISTEWIHHFQAKHHHFAAAAQYRQSRECLEKRKYGEEVARLKDSLTCVNEALKESRWINRTVLGDLNGLKTRVVEELKRAEKDNDVIYLLPVPAKSELKILDRANMVSAKPPKDVAEGLSMLGQNQPFGRALFEKLVPYAVHQAASIYADRRDRLVSQNIISEIEVMTAKLRDLFQSLNLPGSLQALEKPLGLPPSLVSKAEELRQQDAMYRIKRSLDDTSKLKANDFSMYQEGVSLLEAERKEDESARSKYGTDRWSQPPSTVALQKLYKQSEELSGYLNSAGSSDTLVQTKIREHEHIFRILTGTNRDMEDYVPSSRHVNITPGLDSAASTLRACLNDVSRLETRRKRKIEALRTKAKDDDISQALLNEAARLEREYPMQKIEAGQFETLFDQRLEVYEADTESLLTEQDEQDQIAARLREANNAFVEARKGESTTKLREREKALQELDSGYFKYKEIINNLETGRKFYNDLASHVSRFRETCKSQVQARRLEANQLEADLTGQDFGRMKLEETRMNLRSQKQQQQQQQHLQNSNDPISSPPQQQYQPPQTRQQQSFRQGQAHAPAPVTFSNSAIPFSNAISSPPPPSQQQQTQQPPATFHQPLLPTTNPNQKINAPVPTRVTNPSLPISQSIQGQGPGSGSGGAGMQGMGGPGGLWTPEMGIRFGGPPSSAAGAGTGGK